ncbi:hypothetical protein JBE04_33595 [Streptomyces sp. PRKS01-29]|nr:hypothetical protein [Streptomyces sabulosicollis]MBI0299263.1 hypothetical protein [Streptomyces sabulosicollis]
MRLLRALVPGAALLSSAVLFAPTSSAEEPWRPLRGGGEGIRACVDRAQELTPRTWTCTGGTLTVTADREGKPTDKTYTVAEDFRTTATPAAPRAGESVRDDYDTWCESGTICGRKINDFIAEVKGNVAYGDQNGVIGTFDLILRQAFDGQFPRWRTALDWDSGPEVQPGEWSINCRTNISGGPDDYCGENHAYFASINLGSTRTWWPSPRRYSYNEDLLRDGRRHHDDEKGEFYVHAHEGLWKIGVLHTGRWNKCNVSERCRYYEVPWKP